MSSIDYLNPSERKKVIDEITSNDENLRRKEQSLKAFEIYKGRQAEFILRKMGQELGFKTVQNSRTITSINLTKKIVKEQASLYKEKPKRAWSNLTEDQTAHVEKLYDLAEANIKFKKANEIFKLIDQAALQPVLKDGKIILRALMPHHYDVVPKIQNPEKADAYIISSFDKWRLFSQGGFGSKVDRERKPTFDFTNLTIADADDYKQKVLFYWWTDQFNFITNRNGDLVNENGQLITANESDILNPIGKLPFVDVAADKDFEFFVRSGNNIAEMTVDLGVLVSDVTEIARLQGFSQGVISSVEQPKDMIVGPRRLVWLKVNPNDTDATRPSFEFTSPSPDLASSLTLISNYLSLFLTSQGLNPKVVSTAGEAEKYNSGVDRYLSMVSKFEASQDDMSLFTTVESETWDIIKRWNNTYALVTENGFMRELSGVVLPQDSDLFIQYTKPSMLMNETEKIGLIEKKMDLGLMTRAEAIALDRDISVEEAKIILDLVDAETGG